MVELTDINKRFEREKKAFLKIRDKLLKDEMYLGKYIAIYNGRVIAHGRNIEEVIRGVYTQYGDILPSVYIDKVEKD